MYPTWESVGYVPKYRFGYLHPDTEEGLSDITDPENPSLVRSVDPYDPNNRSLINQYG